MTRRSKSGNSCRNQVLLPHFPNFVTNYTHQLVFKCRNAVTTLGKTCWPHFGRELDIVSKLVNFLNSFKFGSLRSQTDVCPFV